MKFLVFYLFYGRMGIFFQKPLLFNNKILFWHHQTNQSKFVYHNNLIKPDKYEKFN